MWNIEQSEKRNILTEFPIAKSQYFIFAISQIYRPFVILDTTHTYITVEWKGATFDELIEIMSHKVE